MAQASNYMETEVLNGLLNGTSITLSPAKPYIALLTSAPSDDNPGVEVAGNGYARVQIGSTGQGDFAVDGQGEAVNDSEFRWSDCLNDWGTVTHVGLFDASAGGNLLIYGTLQQPIVLETGDIFKVPAGGFTIRID
jgi:hypothetical protein